MLYHIFLLLKLHKWQGNQKECDNILADFDFSAITPDILVAKYALEDNTEKVVECMNRIGTTSEIMTKESYLSWVIFKEMREKNEFQNAYKSIFGEELKENLLTLKENEVINENLKLKSNQISSNEHTTRI